MKSSGARHRSMHVAVGVVAAVAALTISACSGSGSGSSGSPKTIKLVAAEYSAKSGPYWQNVAAAFKKKTGITVDVQMVSWANIHQQVSTMVQTKQLPDVLNLDTFTAYAQEGLLWPATDVETAALRNNIPQNLQTSGDYNGTAYGIPLVASASVLFYNKALFAKAGLSGPPTTTAQLQTDAKAITDLPGNNIGFAVSLGPEAPQIDWSMVMYNFGGNYLTNGKWTINSAQNVTALQWLNTMATNKLTEVNPGRTNRTASGTWQLFASGKAGMVIGQSALQDQLKQAPNVQYALAPFPSADGSHSKSLGITDYLMAFKKSNNQSAVQQFLDFAYQAANYNTFIANEGLLPVTSDEQQALSSNPTFAPYIAALKTAVFPPVGEKSWDAVLGAMKNSLGLAVQGQDPKKVLNELQAAATSGS